MSEECKDAIWDWRYQVQSCNNNILAATNQLSEHFFLSVCLSVRPSVVRPSVCLSVCHTFSPCSCHRIITKFSGVITNDRSDVHAKSQGYMSKVKVTAVITQLSRFRSVTPVWIHIWWWNDAWSLMLLRRCALLFFKVTQDKKSSILTQIGSFLTVTPVWIHQWLRNDVHCLKKHRRVALLFFKVKFQGHTGQ